MSDFAVHYLATAMALLSRIDAPRLDRLAETLMRVRGSGGRLFVCGLGGSAATASHAVNDFRKLCHLEAYCPTDNVAELTARANDTSFTYAIRVWLKGSRLGKLDAVLILSVSGESKALLMAAQQARLSGAYRIGIFGREGSTIQPFMDDALVLPCPDPTERTTQAEGAMSVILHCLVAHPALQVEPPAWEARQ